MQGYQQYQQLLNSAISEGTENQNSLQSAYQSKLAVATHIKDTIDRATESVGTLFLAKPAEQLVKGIGKKLGGKLVANVKDALQEKSTDVGETVTEKSAETEAQDSLGQSSQPGAFEETGQELSDLSSATEEIPIASADLPEPSMSSAFDTGRPIIEDMSPNDQALTTLEASGEQQAQDAQQALFGSTDEFRDSLGPLRDSMNARNAGTITENSVENTAENTVESIAGNTAEDVIPAIIPAVAEDVIPAAVAAVPEALTDVALLADPFTFLFGLIAGVATIVGGIEGGEASAKNPAVPKPQPIANVSTQFGIGAN